MADGVVPAAPAAGAATPPRRGPRVVSVAFVAWALLAGLFAFTDPSVLRAPPAFAWGIGTLVLPSLLLGAILALPFLPFARTRRFGAGVGAVVALLLALLWALVAAVGLASHADPYHWIPWLGPPSIADFARRHPQFDVSTFPHDTRVRDRAGRAVIIDGHDLGGSTLVFEPCAGAPGAERFAGMPPAPQVPCAFRYRVRRGADARVVYVFQRHGERPIDDPATHFHAWARSIGAAVGGSVTGPRNTALHRIEIRQGERQWHVRIRKTKYDATVRIADGAVPPELPW